MLSTCTFIHKLSGHTQITSRCPLWLVYGQQAYHNLPTTSLTLTHSLTHSVEPICRIAACLSWARCLTCHTTLSCIQMITCSSSLLFTPASSIMVLSMVLVHVGLPGPRLPWMGSQILLAQPTLFNFLAQCLTPNHLMFSV